MSYPGFLALGSVEIVNHLRTTTYLRTLQCPVEATGSICATLGAYLDDPEYTTPAADDAPWYDATGDPDTKNFAGILVTNIVGLDTSSMTRTVTDNAGDGASVGRTRRRPRTIVVTAWLYGVSCCGTAAGLRWLSRALAEPECPDGIVAECNGADLCYLDCCPTEDVDAESSPFIGVGRTLHQVTCTDGPQVLAKFGRSCGACGCHQRIQVEFTLTAADPYAYRDPSNLITGLAFGETGGDCVTWSVDLDDCPDCDPPSNPYHDPALVIHRPPRPPVIVPVLGGCAPLSSEQECIAISSALIPLWAQAVPTLTIHAGADDVRNLLIGFAAVDEDDECTGESGCAFEDRFAVQLIPAGGTLVIDGARRTVRLTTAGGVTRDADSLVAGLDSQAFNWPLLCCGSYCMCLDFASDADASPTGTITVDLTVREA